MKRTLLLTFALLVLLALPGIAAAQTPPRRVGMMQVAGSNAFLNGQPVRTRDPVVINDGDYVSTGAATSVRIGLTADGYGGIIQLDENTDPNLIIATRCIVMRMVKGQALVNAKNICMGTTNLSSVTRSVVNFKVDDTGGTTVTVIEGQLEVEKPAPMTIAASERLVVLADGTVHRYPVNATEAARSAEWTQRYEFGNPASADHPPGGSGWKKWVPIVGGAAVLCAFGVICDRDNDNGNDGGSGSSNDRPAQSVACCTYNDGVPDVMQATARECADRGGTAYPSQQAATRACTVAPMEPAPPSTVRCCRYNNGAPYPVETTAQECAGSQDWVIPPGMDAQCSTVR